MALSYSSVQAAYVVFNQIREKHIPDLSIPAWPDDVSQWLEEEFKDAWPNKVYGYDRKSDDGWENLFFWCENPSDELKKDFEELQKKVPNSHTSRFDELTGMWKFGWF